MWQANFVRNSTLPMMLNDDDDEDDDDSFMRLSFISVSYCHGKFSL